MKFYGRAEDTAQKLIDAFKRGDVAKPLAQVFIKKGDRPMDNWSWMNQYLCVLSGCTDARGFRQWKKVKRFVKKGESAMGEILVPLIGKGEDEAGEEVSYLYGFRSSPVFDISQTDGEPLPDLPDERAFIDTLPLLQVADRFGLEVATYSGENTSAHGFYIPNRQLIALGVENVSTWLHELMHAADNKLGNLKERGQHWRSETVAELGGAVLATMLGLEIEADAGGAWDYVSKYATAADIEPLSACMQVLNRMCKAINLILETADELGEAVS